MLGKLGSSIIGTNHLTGPTADNVDTSARFARHELVRGKPALQDLGDDARTRRLSFFFDETFCTPETEMRAISSAFQSRLPLKLFIDMTGFEIGVFLIERLAIKNQKTSPSGRVVRIELEAELVESTVSSGGVLGAAAGFARAISNPFLRRG